MKKFILIIMLIPFLGISQKIGVAVLKNKTKTTTEMNAYSPSEGWEVYNSTTKTKWIYNGATWVNTGVPIFTQNIDLNYQSINNVSTMSHIRTSGDTWNMVSHITDAGTYERFQFSPLFNGSSAGQKLLFYNFSTTNWEIDGSAILTSAASNNDIIDSKIITDGYVVQASDGITGRTVLIYNGAADISITFPDVLTSGQKVGIRQQGDGKIDSQFTGGAIGVNLQTIDNKGSVVVWKDVSDGYNNEGNWSEYQVGLELYDLANAAASVEVNGIAGFSSDSGINSITSVAITPVGDSGSFAVRIQAADGTSDRAITSVTLSANTIYDYVLIARNVVGTTGRSQLWTGINTGHSNPLHLFTGTFQTFTGSIQTDGSGIVGVRNYASNSGSAGDQADIALISFKLQ